MVKIVRLVTSLGILLTVLCTGFSCNSVLNQKPDITGLTASNESVNPGGTSQISCTAVDADRDTLTYAWEATGGTISGEGATVTWTAPQSSSAYTIKVTVSDGRGGDASADVTVDVLAAGNTAPIIRGVTSVPPAPQVWDEEPVVFTCDAFDPDGDEIVSYHWSVTADNQAKYPVPGTFVGDGATATWTPPDVANKDSFTVSVYCVDSRGNRSRAKYIPYEVWCTCIRESGSK